MSATTNKLPTVPLTPEAHRALLLHVTRGECPDAREAMCKVASEAIERWLLRVEMERGR